MRRAALIMLWIGLGLWVIGSGFFVYLLTAVAGPFTYPAVSLWMLCWSICVLCLLPSMTILFVRWMRNQAHASDKTMLLWGELALTTMVAVYIYLHLPGPIYIDFKSESLFSPPPLTNAS